MKKKKKNDGKHIFIQILYWVLWLRNRTRKKFEEKSISIDSTAFTLFRNSLVSGQYKSQYFNWTITYCYSSKLSSSNSPFFNLIFIFSFLFSWNKTERHAAYSEEDKKFINFITRFIENIHRQISYREIEEQNEYIWTKKRTSAFNDMLCTGTHIPN